MRGPGVCDGRQGANGNDGGAEDTCQRGVPLEGGAGARGRRYRGGDGVAGGRASSRPAVPIDIKRAPIDRERFSAIALLPHGPRSRPRRRGGTAHEG